MTTWVNFAEIRSSISLEDVILRYYAITTLTRHENKLIGPCPVHNGDSPRAFHADLDKNAWHCFSQCRRGGNQLDFVAVKEGITIREAALRLKEAFSGTAARVSDNGCRNSPPGTSRTPSGGTTSTVPQEQTVRPTPSGNSVPATRGLSAAPEKTTVAPQQHNPPLDLNLQLKADHPHLTGDRKLTLETIRHFGVGWCGKGILRGCIAIPIHDESGILVAYAGRRLRPNDIREKGKYLFPKGFHKELVLYNFHRVKEEANEKGLVLVEGFFTVLKLLEAGITNAVAVMGCALSDAQATLLASCKDVTLLFDGNDAGYAGATAAKEKLSPHVTVRVVQLPPGLEPDDMSPRALRWIVHGMSALDLTDLSFRTGTSTE